MRSGLWTTSPVTRPPESKRIFGYQWEESKLSNNYAPLSGEYEQIVENTASRAKLLNLSS